MSASGHRPTFDDIHDTFGTDDTMTITTRTTGTLVALATVGALATGTAWIAFADRGGPRPEPSGDPANAPARLAAQRPAVEVWKTPTCGCCQGWVDYLEAEGFEVVAHDVDDIDPIRTELGLTDARLNSCHTASIGGYVVEGHVPVSDIERLLAERPDIVGVAAPGMPMMSPGMGSIEPKDYDVVSFAENGDVAVFSSH